MIIKGGSRGGPKQLAAHLMRGDTNERVRVLELDSPLDSLAETFRDWQVLAGGTRGKLGLYHAQINPDARYEMTPDQWKRTVEVLEKELGFDGQPRAVVMHEKHGRAHIHVVWARTDVETMTLRPDSHNYQSHERASHALELEFGHEHVPGKHAKRDRKKQPEFPQSKFLHGEWQQAERTGVDPRERKEQVTALFQASDGCAAFKVALEQEGYILAKGDRRDFVIVDEAGEIHSLARQINGVKAKDLRAYMEGLDRDKLPTAEQAKEMQAATLDQAPAKEISPPQPKEDFEKAAATSKAAAAADRDAVERAERDRERQAQEERDKLEAALARRKADDLEQIAGQQESELAHLRKVLAAEAAEKLKAFDEAQKRERDRKLRERVHFFALDLQLAARIRKLVRPDEAKKREQKLQAEWNACKRQQALQRVGKVSVLQQEIDQEVEELRERHDQRLRDYERRSAEERERYLRELERQRLAQEERERKMLDRNRQPRAGPKQIPERDSSEETIKHTR